MGTEVGYATLRAMNQGKDYCKVHSSEDRAEGLAGFGGIDGEGFPCKILFAVFPSFNLFSNTSDFIGVMSPFKPFFACKQVLVKQFGLVFDVVNVILSHDSLQWGAKGEVTRERLGLMGIAG